MKFIPPIIDSKSPGEKWLMETFQELENNKVADWVILHSLDIREHIAQKKGEADFVLIIPKKGILIIEVKAVKSVKYEKGMWTLGQNEPESRGPFKQASDNCESFERKLKKEFPVLKDILMWHVVIFTEIEFDIRSPTEWEDWEFIDRPELNEAIAQKSFFKLFEKILEKAKTKFPKNKYIKNAPDNNQYDVLLKYLRPNFHKFISPKDRKENHENILIKSFTLMQHNALETIALNPRCIVEGPAGTGKTLLAIEQARINVSRKKRTLFLCFNNQIGQFIKDQLSSIEGNYLEVSTFYKYMKKYLNINDVNFLPTMLAERIANNEIQLEEYDYLIIDEAQILLNSDYEIILESSIKNGFDKGQYTLFGDFYLQKTVYDEFRNYNSVDLEEFANNYNVSRIPLKDNCRNSKNLVEYMDQLIEINPYQNIVRRDNTPIPKSYTYSNPSEQLLVLLQVLEKLYYEGFDNNEVVILTFKSEKNSDFHFLKSARSIYSIDKNIAIIHFNSFLNLNNATDNQKNDIKDKYIKYFFTAKNKVKFTTINKFIGMESPAIIITDINDLNKKALLHLGMTRSTDRLYLLKESKK